MSRSSKRQKKEAREKLRSTAVLPRSHARRTGDDLDRAIRLLERGERREAQEVLETCERTLPNSKEVLHALLGVYQKRSDYAGICRAGRRLVELEPGNQSLNLSLAAAYHCNGQPVSALQAFRRFIERWPSGKLADEAREVISQLEPMVDEILGRAPFPLELRLELAALHEEVLASIPTGDEARTIELAEQLLARYPDFVPAMNNLAHAYFKCGRAHDAMAMSHRVLEREPDNFHAVANLARHLLLSGRDDEAEEWHVRLRSIRSNRDDVWCKKAEGLSFFGDDQAVIQALDDARQAGCTKHKVPDVALLYHLAAVAHARQGDLGQARRLWKHAIKVYPGLQLAKDNLADSDKPIGDRDGPWPYTIEYWIRKEAIDELLDAIRDPVALKDDEAIGQEARRAAQRHPELLIAVPLLLDRGDKGSRSFALLVAKLVETPKMLESLRVFCLSQRGPDAVRIETANYLCQKGVLSSGATRLWLRGAWQEIELLGFEITDEPTDPKYSHPQSAEWTIKAFEALQRRDGQTAQTLLEKCLAAEGDRPELLNNLAFAYRLQDRIEESDALSRHVHERWPDYFFGRVNMADIATREGDFERADALLADLLRQRRLHTTEFTALCTVSIQLFVLRGKVDAARSWLAIWKKTRPDDPAIARAERMIARAAATRSLGGWLRNHFRPNAQEQGRHPVGK